MTTQVTITGTGTPLATHDRAGAGVLVRYGDVHLQFDAGRATVPRLLATGSSPAKLSALFLTHYHSDHVVGVQDLVLSHWTMDVYDEAARLPLLAPNGSTIRFCERMLDLWDHDLEIRSLHNHRAPHPKVEGAVGYRIETPDGVVAISGDTVVCDEVAALADGADVVVYEAMRMDVIAQRPPDKQYIMHYHADTRQIGRQMAELTVPTVMLTHLIPAPVTDADKQAFIDEVREGGYRGEIMVCDDLDTVTLGDGSSA
jgi:ribonuclease Z